ncbi:uncharacterized protein LOC125646127 [Ostrea edulis]|uniref:uncharacterized protein LOC125646127 n=1 Tax=Ostrea edulis TaxID=37623 RepID=UPI002094CFBF|nr:uncharacterized protein LOC125646127 [Ostrea edulis]
MIRNISIFLQLGYIVSVVLSLSIGVGKIVQRQEKPDRVRRSTQDGGELPPLPMTSRSRQGGGSHQSGYGSDASGIQIPNFEPEYRSYDVSQGQRSSSQSGSQSSGVYNSRPDNSYTPSTNRQTVYSSGGTTYSSYNPGNTGGGSVIQRGGSSYPSGSRSVVYPASRSRANVPNTGVMSNDPNCPAASGYDVYINGLRCNEAVRNLGKFICYTYERASRECCQTCLAVKQSYNTGCEYGDRSYQCRNIEPFDCYVARTRDICCDRCAQFLRQLNTGVANCAYGDLTPRCTVVNQKRHLCYLPENQRLCCITCPRVATDSTPGCRWGDQNPELCTPYTPNGLMRINCYQSSVNQVCCRTCEHIKNSVRSPVAGCEYGDKPVSINTPRGTLNCADYLHYAGETACNDSEIRSYCCHTCYRYRQARAGSSGQ